jgi:hypothetical protein
VNGVGERVQKESAVEWGNQASISGKTKPNQSIWFPFNWLEGLSQARKGEESRGQRPRGCHYNKETASTAPASKAWTICNPHC